MRLSKLEYIGRDLSGHIKTDVSTTISLTRSQIIPYNAERNKGSSDGIKSR